MGYNILVIEDNPANLELMSYLLRAREHRLSVAVDGREGLNLALTGAYDAIVCDVALPGIDGHEIAKRLTTDRGARSTPLIAVTAYAMAGDAQRALSVGFDAYIPKPIDPERFVDQVEGLVRLATSAGCEAAGAAATCSATHLARGAT